MSNIIIFNCQIPHSFAVENKCSKIVVEKQSGRVLYAENENQIRPMASTTKILTAITIIENCKLDDIVTITNESVGVEGSSIYLKVGERLKVIDLLYGLMLRSGNDSAVALALHCSQSIECFSELMNETAKKCGATNSHFSNPHGLNDDEHYTTAKDLALITAYALKNDTFAKIVKTKKITVENYDGEKRYFINKNKMLNCFDGADGVKTGFTKVAGRCLVSSATRGEMQLICVVLGCSPMFEESTRLLDECFNKFQLEKLSEKNKPVGELTITNHLSGEAINYRVATDSSFSYPLSKAEIENIKTDVNIFNVKKPDNVNPIGEINFTLENNLLYSQKLFIIDNIKQMDLFSALKIVLKYW